MARCEMCGTSLTWSLVRFNVPDFDGNSHLVCGACNARAQGKALKYDPQIGKVIICELEDLEVRKKCATCGHIFCYTALDVLESKNKELSATFSKVSALGGTMNGNFTQSAVELGNAQNASAQVVDYNRCPRCGSMNLHTLDKQEYQAELNKVNTKNTATSAADELKKFKDLLDMGVITQEEFDQKKKQLLGL